MIKAISNNVDKYIAAFSTEKQELLVQIRTIVKKLAPEAQERISYGMPSYKLNGRPLVYFAAFKKHIGFYAIPTGHTEFAKELSKYKQGKGSVQFLLDEPLPLSLIEKMVKFRINENAQKEKKKTES